MRPDGPDSTVVCGWVDAGETEFCNCGVMISVLSRSNKCDGVFESRSLDRNQLRRARICRQAREHPRSRSLNEYGQVLDIGIQ